MDRDEPLGVREGQRPQQNGPDDGEDRRIGPDRQGEGADDRGGEARAAEDAPESEADVAEEVREHGDASIAATLGRIE